MDLQTATPRHTRSLAPLTRLVCVFFGCPGSCGTTFEPSLGKHDFSQA